MKFGTNLRKKIRGLAKRSQLIVRLYNWFQFLKTIPGKDLLNLGKDIGKTRLILTVKPYTLMNYRKLSVLYELACRLEIAQISGSFVECGVYKGGSAAIIATAAKQNVNRHVWLFDSWEGWPEPDERDLSYDLKLVPEKGECLGSEEKARELLFSRLQLDSNRVHLVKGWFANTLPMKEVGVIALLHLDCDLYESVKFCLEQLYDNVIKGGCIVIDDYIYWKGCKQAVDEFINRRNLRVELINVDNQVVYFHKEA